MTLQVLVIDDDAELLSIMAGAFRKAGFDTCAARNGREGLKMFHEKHPQLVVTDIVMPDQEGIGTILQLKRCPNAPKVIAISGGGNFHVDYLEWAKHLGADEVLPKPFRMSALIAAAASLLDGAALPLRSSPSLASCPSAA